MGSFAKEFEYVLEEYADKNAITYLDEESKTFVNLTYKSVKEHFEICCKNIYENVKEEQCCIGLLMLQNPYIPGLLMSLQKLGQCFIFLNPDDPKTKHVKLVERLNIKWLISSADKEKHPTVLDDFSLAAQVISEFTLWKSKLDLNLLNTFEDISYVIYTSGTTGANKIVKVQNYCIYSNVKSVKNILKVTSEDVIYFGTSLTFDPSMVEFFLAVITGATLLILPRKTHANPRKLFQNLFPHNHKATTILQMSPSVFLRFIAEEIDFIFQKSGLKVLCLGGENFPNNLMCLPRKNDLRIFNLYGITEVSCWASFCEIKDERINLGTALAETLLEIRDEDGNCIKEGTGEMFIGSSSRICLIENEIFSKETPKPIFRATGDVVKVHNNVYTYVGRKNDMIKRYGTRIILSNIENEIFKKLHLINKCVWFELDCKLLLFFLIENFDFTQKEKIVDQLRVKLLHFLPKEHFPDFIDVIKTLPITFNGKLDLIALRELFLFSRQLQPNSSNSALQVFNGLLLRYFGVNSAENDATFLEIGANSIVLLQFFEEFKMQFNENISNEFLTMLFEKTIDDCRKFINSLTLPKAKKRKLFEQNQTTKTTTNLTNIIFKILWKYDMKACVDCSPILIDKSKTEQLIAVGSFAHIFAIIEASSGSKLIEIVLPETIEAACSVSACKNFVYVGCFDCKMYCIKIDDGSITWKFSTGDRIKSTPSLCKNSTAIVFGSYDKHLYCLNCVDGSLIWKTNLQNIINTQAVVFKNRIFVATIVGKCFCVAECDGSIVWECFTQHPVLGSPCFIENKENGFICWPNVNGNLQCFSCNDGKLIWEYHSQNQIFCSLLHHNGHILFGCHGNFLHCLKTKNNSVSLKFKTTLDAPISSKSCILPEKLIIVTPTTAGSLFLISLQNGEIQSQINLGAQIFSSPCVCSEKIYVGCRDNNLYCLEINKTH